MRRGEIMSRYAEDLNYWQTTVHPAVSQGEIVEMLERFGATAVNTMTGQTEGKYAWMIRFMWDGKSYRFLFTPLECHNPGKVYSIGGKRRSAEEQSRYQMGRIAVGFIKALLTAAGTTPAALFGFLELPGNGGMPMTAAELDVNDLTAMLPDWSKSTVKLLNA